MNDIIQDNYGVLCPDHNIMRGIGPVRNKRKSFFESEEVEIEFDSLSDEIAYTDDFEDSDSEFADEGDFDEEELSEEEFSEEDYYDEDNAGVYGESDYVEDNAAEEYVQNEYYEEEYSQDEYSHEEYSQEEYPQEEDYFDDHVEYFYDDEFAESEAPVVEEPEFGTRASAGYARRSVEAAGGVRVHKKPIVRIDEADEISSAGAGANRPGPGKPGPGRPGPGRPTPGRPVRYDNFEEDIEIENDYEDKGEKRSLGAIEKLMIALAACVVLVLIGVGGYIAWAKPFSKPVSNINENGIAYNAELSGAGSQIAGISTIGGKGLQAAYEAKKGSDTTPVVVVTEPEDTYQEIDYSNEIEIAFETVSVVKDLKIKIINKNTGKLIANVPFVVTVTTPAGNIQTWTDSDKDGVIYYSEIPAGTYKIHLENLDSTKYAGYVLPVDAKPDVRSELAYEKVDVSGEVLAAGDVNEATEDTARDGADSGSGTLTDTVTYVASSKVENYVQVDATVVINQTYGGVASLGGTYYSDTVVVCEGNPPTISGDASMSVNVGASSTLTLTLENYDPETYSVSADSANKETATVAFDENSRVLTVTGVAAGNTTATVVIKNKADGSEVAKKEIAVTVNAAPTPTAGTIAVGFTKFGLLPGKTGDVTVTLNGIDISDVEASSSNTGVATVALSADGKTLTITSVSAGTTTVTVKQKSNDTVKATVEVSVYASTEPLTATVGGQTVKLYIKESDGTYREACYIDRTVSPTFYYINGSSYTGWQTIDGKTYYYTSEGKPVTGEQVIGGVLYNFDNTGAMVVGNGTLGIDVSKWNGDINWSKVKAAGVSYVIIRVGYRGSTLGGLIDDTNFKKNIEGAQAAGLKVGVYFVTQAINDAEAVYEASMVLDRISKYTISYPVFLDVEASGGRGDKIDVATRTSVCKTFCKTIQNAGYTAGIYANKSWLTNKIDASQLTSYKIWVAQYNSTCTYSGSYSMWQYTDSGTIDGISGKVDLNKSYLGY